MSLLATFLSVFQTETDVKDPSPSPFAPTARARTAPASWRPSAWPRLTLPRSLRSSASRLLRLRLYTRPLSPPPPPSLILLLPPLPPFLPQGRCRRRRVQDPLHKLTTSSQSVGDYFKAKLSAKANGERQPRPALAPLVVLLLLLLLLVPPLFHGTMTTIVPVWVQVGARREHHKRTIWTRHKCVGDWRFVVEVCGDVYAAAAAVYDSRCREEKASAELNLSWCMTLLLAMAMTARKAKRGVQRRSGDERRRNGGGRERRRPAKLRMRWSRCPMVRPQLRERKRRGGVNLDHAITGQRIPIPPMLGGGDYPNKKAEGS
ncbi:hypothetical protein BJV74DRAFT_280480 [Russula compacta]|nr:hypothetical protein BJV74DRAFT_280480 [Russula compacta]